MISKQVLDLEPQFIAWRRELHAVPELSFQEVQTTEFLLKHLRSIPGLTIEQPTKTGVVAVLRGAHPGRTIALRADIDALPIQEETDLPFASKTPGVMHACGHDGHAAMQLAAAQILAGEREQLHGEVRFLFQHAEELPPAAPWRW
ncbi:MAG: amidohydrolase [Dysosmobacter sp.]